MKHFFLFALLLYMPLTASEQCPTDPGTDDVRVIPLSIKTGHSVYNINGEYITHYYLEFEICKPWALHNEVHFLPFLNLESTSHVVKLDFGDGSPEVTLMDEQIIEHTYPVNSSGVNLTYQIKARWTNPPSDGGNNNYSTTKESPFVIKATTSVNGAGYTPPDEVWEISTNAAYPPPVQGAFPSGSSFNGSAVGGAHAYIKYAPAHNGKMLKPLIFVDGLDFGTKTYTHEGQIIRQGSTGWDIFVLGNDASEPNDNEALPSEFRHYPAALNTFLSENNNYDIVFLDFGGGTDWIQKNGLLLVELIRRVNERKATYAVNGETVCDNAVIGASMGGQVAKWALSYMEAVAALWQPELGAYSSNCQQYINVAKAFIDGNDANNLPRSGSELKQPQASGNLLIAPNPANSTAIIHLVSGEHLLNIWDAQGRLMLQTTAIGNFHLETATWAPGIYLVSATSNTGAYSTGKLVLNK